MAIDRRDGLEKLPAAAQWRSTKIASGNH